MHKKYINLILISIIFIPLDQITKYFIAYTMDLYESIEIIRNFFNITYTKNSGAAFGFLNGRDSIFITVFFIIVSVIAIAIIGLLYKKAKADEKLLHISLSLILSGAAGNLIDRVVNHEVIDFLDVHWKQYHWPVFNIADSCITVGMILLVINTLKESAVTSQCKNH